MPTAPGGSSALLAYEAVVARGGDPRHAGRVREMRAAFESRAGAFGPDDPWFEARSRAFWDDAVTTQGFAAEVAPELDRELRRWASAFGRAHRGLFRASRESGAFLLEDAWSGAAFLLTEVDEAMIDSLTMSVSLLDGRLVGLSDPVRVALLPGAVFHPPEATEPLEAVLLAAREKPLSAHAIFDALLRMERRFAGLSRMKASFAYRADALSRKESFDS